MPIFERPPLGTLAPAKDRWTPIYLEHGRIEVDDSSINWIGSDGFITRLPIATLSARIHATAWANNRSRNEIARRITIFIRADR